MAIRSRRDGSEGRLSDTNVLAEVQASNKPKLAAAKVVSHADTEAYDDVLDDDDFM